MTSESLSHGLSLGRPARRRAVLALGRTVRVKNKIGWRAAAGLSELTLGDMEFGRRFSLDWSWICIRQTNHQDYKFLVSVHQRNTPRFDFEPGATGPRLKLAYIICHELNNTAPPPPTRHHAGRTDFAALCIPSVSASNVTHPFTCPRTVAAVGASDTRCPTQSPHRYPAPH